MAKKHKQQVPLLRQIRSDHKRFGYWKCLLSALDNGVNRFLRVDCLLILLMGRDLIQRTDVLNAPGVSLRYATHEDLLQMQEDGRWEISATKLNSFLDGDHCVLSYVGSELGGYSWVHLKGRPYLMDNLRIEVPDDYMYGYASLTLPRFRGASLMLARRYALLNNPRWLAKQGILNYTKATNWGSLRGQRKSSNRTIGFMWLLRVKGRYFVWLSPKVKQFGIKRLA